MTLNLIRPGAFVESEGVTFNVWAPFAQTIDVVLEEVDLTFHLDPAEHGYFNKTLPGVHAGDRYFYRINNGASCPDPASFYQPKGVHSASEVVDHTFDWDDASWAPPALKDSVLYELHVGTFTQEGTFESIIPHLPYLKDLGVTTLQLMPVAQFPGSRNWGYDGVYLYAPHNSYGGPPGLKKLVQACHKNGLALYLDVVYNHLGPEGNYLWQYGPYFTDQYKSPWGSSINLDGPYSDAVRHFFIQNAIHWLEYYHIDGLRLDATHALFDFSARPFLTELSQRVAMWANRAGRQVHLIAENDQSDRMLTLPISAHGKGIDSQWLDDLHHTMHVALTKEKEGYYLDYQDPSLFVKVLKEGFAYSGQYSPSRKRQHGTYAGDLSTDRFIVSTQTHDQIGNRMLGERLTQLTTFEGLKLAACLLASSPYVPMLFMGEEYGETAPFLYFISHSDEHLIDAVRQGRKEEFEDFEWAGSPPDPQGEATFICCTLDHSLREMGHHLMLHKLYKELLHFRASHPALRESRRNNQDVYGADYFVCMERRSLEESIRIFMNFNTAQKTMELDADSQKWQKILSSYDPSWRLASTPRITLPTYFEATNSMTLTLPPLSFVIYKSLHS